MRIDRAPLSKGRCDGHGPQIETGFLKRRRMPSCLLAEQSIAAAPAWRVKDTLGTSGFGTWPETHTVCRNQSGNDAGRPLQSYQPNANFKSWAAWQKLKVQRVTVDGFGQRFGKEIYSSPLYYTVSRGRKRMNNSATPQHCLCSGSPSDWHKLRLRDMN